MLKTNFVKSVTTLIAGTGIAQIITIASSPILTRIYNPIEFGKLAFFMSSCALISILSTGRYELAIMLPKSDKKAINLLILVILLSFLINLLFFILIIMFGSNILKMFNISFAFSTLILIPIGSFFLSCYQGINFWLSRKNNFKVISATRILQSVGALIFSIYIGLYETKTHGLIIGYLLGLLLSIYPVFFIFKKGLNLISNKHILYSLKKYKSYPLFMTPTAFMDTFAMQAPIFFITKFYNSAIVGAYSLAFRIVTAPIGLISGAIGQVYFQKITKQVNNKEGNIKYTLINTAKSLSFISILIFVPFLFFGCELFEFIFGKYWRDAGRYVEIISFAMLIRFIISPLSTIFISTNNLKIGAFWQSLYFLTTISIFYVARGLKIESLLWIYVIHEILLYTFYFILMYNVSIKFDKRNICVE